MPVSAARAAIRFRAATLLRRPATVGPDGYLWRALYVMPGRNSHVRGDCLQKAGQMGKKRPKREAFASIRIHHASSC